MVNKFKSKTKLEYRMSEDCRRSKERKDIFLKWVVSRPEYRKRKPTVAEVVRECRRKNSPLGILIEQSVKKAAEENWRNEAQYYLRHTMVVRVNIVTKQVITQPVRAWIPVKVSKGGRIDESDYLVAQRVADSPLLRRSVIERAHSDILAWINRYERYADFMGEFHEVIEAYRNLKKRMESIIRSGGNDVVRYGKYVSGGKGSANKQQTKRKKR
ncbi:MAG: hypothetical protein CMN84_05890 [Spongiibacteraceae bacterium]|mgnify:FL=1|nr:hypothetical protein [Spongiibacteraceae bacterium]